MNVFQFDVLKVFESSAILLNDVLFALHHSASRSLN